jgi:hypothetical protein
MMDDKNEKKRKGRKTGKKMEWILMGADETKETTG